MAKLTYARKLKQLHAWNGWFVVLLAVTGVLLVVPAFRSAMPQVRVWTKDAHIVLGMLSLLPIILYIPLALRHYRQIRRNKAQLWNLWIVLAIMLGWSISGILLWQHRHIPASWSNTALIWHDLISWIGLPYAIFHSLTRMRWVKRAGFKPLIDRTIEADSQVESNEQAGSLSPGERLRREASYNQHMFSRRKFIQYVLGFLLVISVAPVFYQWLKKNMYSDETALEEILNSTMPADPNVPTDASQMIPPPEPLPSSNPPIGGGASGRFRIYTVTEMPTSRVETWSFEVTGLVDRPILYDWHQFMALSREVQVSDFHCVTGWSVNQCTWEGIKLSALLDAAGVKSTAKYVKFYSGDGVYTDTLTIEQARMDDVLVASLLDGKPLPKTLGGPVRLIVPQMYAYKSVKWLQAIELIDKEEDGYWIVRGYPKDAWVKT